MRSYHLPEDIVILIGLPGSGKGTQGRLLQNLLGAVHISSGAVVRAQTNPHNQRIPCMLMAEYARIRGMRDRGELIPDEMMIDLLFNRISAYECRPQVILDGFPRTKAQAELLALRMDKGTVITVIYLKVPEGNILPRLCNRLSCDQCSNSYHVISKPPIQEGLCDGCRGRLFIRKDDSSEIIKTRLETSKVNLKELVEWYDNPSYRFIEIDASKEEGEVQQEIARKMVSFMKEDERKIIERTAQG